MFYDHHLIEKTVCSEEEKKECLDLIEEFINLANIARKEGLLALDDIINNGYDLFMTSGLRLIVDGVPPAVASEILKNRIYFGMKKGKALLEQFIMYEGILSIQEGENPGILKSRLLALLGDQGDQMDVGLAEVERKMFIDYIEFLQTRELPENGVPVLDEFIPGLSDWGVQRILREVSSSELAVALSGSSGKVMAIVLKNMTFRAGWKLKEEMEGLDAPRISDVKAAQDMIFDIYKKLQELGEV